MRRAAGDPRWQRVGTRQTRETGKGGCSRGFVHLVSPCALLLFQAGWSPGDRKLGPGRDRGGRREGRGQPGRPWAAGRQGWGGGRPWDTRNGVARAETHFRRKSGLVIITDLIFGCNLCDHNNNGFHLQSTYSVPDTLPTVAYLTISHEVALSIPKDR